MMAASRKVRPGTTGSACEQSEDQRTADCRIRISESDFRLKNAGQVRKARFRFENRLLPSPRWSCHSEERSEEKSASWVALERKSNVLGSEICNLKFSVTRSYLWLTSSFWARRES